MSVLPADTICAISTPHGIGGIAVIRVSGPNTIAICDKIFRPHTSKSLHNTPTHMARYGQIVSDNDIIDEVLLTLLRAPHSFTGEDTAEISCHGSLYIQQEILKLLIATGCRMANPGEYTQRAFLNGRIDLSQAEAVADLIASQSRSEHILALNQMRGGISNELLRLRERLLHFTSLIELELDFSDHEDIQFANRTELLSLARDIQQKIISLADTFSTGNAIKNGIPIAIVGETNVGKSTLLNALLGEDRAIVSDIQGTTRDTLEDSLNINGTLFRVIDTAGLRQTADAIERLGIQRTYRAIEKSNIILWLVDSTSPAREDKEFRQNIISQAKDKCLIIAFNKVDLVSCDDQKRLLERYADVSVPMLFISAKDGQGVPQLRELIFKSAQIPELNSSSVAITNLRHYQALRAAQEPIARVIDGINNGISPDLLTQDIRECLHYLGEITGQITTDEILHNIFSHFCIGK